MYNENYWMCSIKTRLVSMYRCTKHCSQYLKKCESKNHSLIALSSKFWILNQFDVKE